MWDILKEGRRFMEGDDQDDLERAYRRGCKHGYEKGYREAMDEMRGGYGERGRGYGERDGGYGERDSGYDGGYGERDGGYGERRGVKGTGPYARRRY